MVVSLTITASIVPSLMKRIILTSLFFCLAITTVLAQVTPDGSTNTSTTDSGGVFLINIAAPVSGLSNNTYSDFNVSASGVTLNNDVSNPNITLGNRARHYCKSGNGQ